MNKEVIDKILLASIGAMFMTRERAEEVFDEYLQRWETEKALRGTMVEDLIKRSQEAHRELERLLEDHVTEMARKLNLASNDDVRRLEQKLNKLLEAQGIKAEESTPGAGSEPQPAKSASENTQQES